MGIIAQNCACDSAIIEIKASKFIEMIPFIETKIFTARQCACKCVCVFVKRT